MSATARHAADFNVLAEWDDTDDETYPVGPRRLSIELTGEAPGGIITDLLRRADRHLGDMIGEFNEMPAVGAYQVMVRRYLEDRCCAAGRRYGLPPRFARPTGRSHRPGARGT
jgi:hypothetical protein